MTDLAFVTQLIDPQDAALGFVVSMIEGLAKEFGRVTVIANHVRQVPPLPVNVEVRSLGKERGRGKFARGLAFEGETLRFIKRTRHPSAMLVHMCPEYLNLAAPFARAGRVRLMLWFAHPSDTRKLRMAQLLTDDILTSLPGSYPRASSKLLIVGQATDTERFAFHETPGGSRSVTRLLAIGRTSPSKGFEQMIDMLKLVRLEGGSAHLRIVGPSTTSSEADHARQLKKLIVEKDLQASVTVEPGVAPAAIPALLQDADILINAMVSGSGDKVVFEAMAAGVLPLVSNPAFGQVLGGLPLDLTFERGNIRMLANRVAAISRADPSLLHDVRAALRLRVVQDHSQATWARRVRDAARSGQ
jgi:glycosyltransferase involved in cell wall biosynthesis